MNIYFILVLAVVFTLSGPALSQDLSADLRALSVLERASQPFDKAAYLQASQKALDSWTAASSEEQARFGTQMFLVHFRRAQIMAASGNFAAAATEMAEEAKLQREQGGRLEFSTKSSESFFHDLVELQARVAAETGRDPLAGLVDYWFARDGDDFVAARLELHDEVRGITVPDIAEKESIALWHRLQRKEHVITQTRWLVVPKDVLPDALEEASREIAFSQDGKMVISKLQTGAGTKQSKAPESDMLQAIQRLTEKVQGHRVRSNGQDAIIAMHDLLEQWSPIGKKTNEVKQMLGEPSEEDHTKLVYRFDDGDQAYEWTLQKAGNAIRQLSLELHE